MGKQSGSRRKAPYLILEKIRHGDQDVEVSRPMVEPYLDHTPVLVDNIISTTRTMIETVNHLKKVKMKPTMCVEVHAVFADKAYVHYCRQDLLR